MYVVDMLRLPNTRHLITFQISPNPSYYIVNQDTGISNYYIHSFIIRL